MKMEAHHAHTKNARRDRCPVGFMAKTKDWMDRLSPQAKAEILGSVIHELECATGKNYKAYMKLPRKWRKLAEAAMRDCSIDSSELLPADMKLLQQWLKGEKG
jgi:hypothetical protein